MRNIILSLLACLAALSCGSQSNLNTKDAIRKAVLEHLSARKGLDLNMEAMELDVGDVSFRANEADATVSFRTKGSQTSAMTMKYTLIRDGDHWKVKPRAEGGANPHGMPAAPPPTEMPPGHPPTGAKQ